MRRLGLAAAAAALIPMFAQAQNDTVLVQDDATNLTLRIVRDDPDEKLVHFLATNAKATQLAAEGYPTLPKETGASVGRRLCGFPTDDYWRAFEKRNNLPSKSFDPAKALGETGFGYFWPACFYFERAEFTHVLQPGELAGAVYLAETGSVGTEATHKRFFRTSGISDLNKVLPGQVLRFGYRTRPFVVSVEGDRRDFVTALNALARDIHDLEANALTTPVVSPTVAGGEVILAGVASNMAGAIQSTNPPDCDGLANSPTDTRRIAEAYRFANPIRVSLVRIVVADNGFFGAGRPDGAIVFRTLFDQRFFDITLDQATQLPAIGPVLALDPKTPISPFNLENGFDASYAPTADSGHGTHVTGLALGGDLRNDARFFGPAEGHWLRAGLIAFSPGTREIPVTSAYQFREALRRTTFSAPDVVNMSLKFGPAARQALTELVEDNPTVLFVVSAGNQRADLDSELEIYPAALGDLPNVLAVAAETTPGVLADYTNKSAAVVDLAAPGCNLASTLDGLGPTSLSGTSQSAAVVTFAAALLRRVSLSNETLKRRLVLSGDLITGMTVPKAGGGFEVKAVDRDTALPVRSRSRLNIAKALYKDFDYLRYRKAGVTYEVLGKLGPRTGPACGKETWKFDRVRAFKRIAPGGQAWCFWRGNLEPAAVASAPNHAIQYFEVLGAIAADGTIEKRTDDYLFNLRLDDVDELVLSEANMNLNP